MRHLTDTTSLDEFIGAYGPRHREGLISEHTWAFEKAGGTIRYSTSGTGRQWALVPSGKGEKAYPVVCSEIIKVDTEDGPTSGRCGEPAMRLGACERHAEEIESYMAMSERDHDLRGDLR